MGGLIALGIGLVVWWGLKATAGPNAHINLRTTGAWFQHFGLTLLALARLALVPLLVFVVGATGGAAIYYVRRGRTGGSRRRRRRKTTPPQGT